MTYPQAIFTNVKLKGLSPDGWREHRIVDA